MLDQRDDQRAAIGKVTEFVPLFDRHRFCLSHLLQLVFEHDRADGIQTHRNHRHVAVLFCLDHKVTTVEMLEDTVTLAITDIPAIEEGAKIIDAPIGACHILSGLHHLPETTA